MMKELAWLSIFAIRKYMYIITMGYTVRDFAATLISDTNTQTYKII